MTKKAVLTSWSYQYSRLSYSASGRPQKQTRNAMVKGKSRKRFQHTCKSLKNSFSYRRVVFLFGSEWACGQYIILVYRHLATLRSISTFSLLNYLQTLRRIQVLPQRPTNGDPNRLRNVPYRLYIGSERRIGYVRNLELVFKKRIKSLIKRYYTLDFRSVRDPQ